MTTQAYFENIRPEIVKNLENAQESVFLAVAWFTDGGLLEILEKKAQKGLKIELIVLEDEINERLDFEKLQNLGGKVWKALNLDGLMHHKFCVIDQETVLNGSYNWTYQAQKNDEDLTVTQSKDLGKCFLERFEKLKQKYSSLIELSDEDKIKRLLAFINTNIKKIQTTEDKIKAATQEIENIKQGRQTAQFEKLFLKLQEEPQKESVNVPDSFLEDAKSRGIEIWWKSLSTQWKKILAINVAFEEKGIDYKYIINKTDSAKTVSYIYQKVFGKTFKMSAGVDLSKIKELKFVWCQSENLTNLEPLQKLSNLEILDCDSNQISSLEPLRNLSNLQTLYCDSNQISSLEYLKNLIKLQELYCDSNQISSLEPLRNLSNLQKLFCGENQISSLEPLQNLSNLQDLCCWSNQISSLEPLRNLINLQGLLCNKNQISSLEPLQNLINLKDLWCWSNQISSLEPLRKLINLEELYCQNNQINSLEPLRNLNNLDFLLCDENQISSLEPLQELSGLQAVNCQHNPISQEEIENLEKVLPECTVLW